MFFTFRYAEIPEAFVKLMQLGYSPQLCRRKVVDQRREFKRWFIKKSFKQWPVHTLKVFTRYFNAMILVNFGLLLALEDSPLKELITWIVRNVLNHDNH